MPKNKDLRKAQKNKNDEFYTELSVIEDELRYYKDHFRGKIVFCNCDDPYESNFFKYFALNFNSLGLKKLIVTGYVTSPIIGTEVNVWTGEETDVNSRTPYVAYINEVSDLNNDGRVDLEDVKLILKNRHNSRRKLNGDDVYPPGDFRSEECIKLLQQADIVCTNPPFSLFREYVTQLVQYNKHFLIIGNINAVTYKEIFPLIKENKLWWGCSTNGSNRYFRVPDSYVLTEKTGKIQNGIKYAFVKGVMWYTNLEHKKRHEDLLLFKQYSSDMYLKYDNFDAINVDKVVSIPYDYNGIMGVPITFLNKYNPEQFELLGFWNNGASGDLLGAKKIEIKTSGKSIFWNGPTINGKATYFRILIRNKKLNMN